MIQPTLFYKLRFVTQPRPIAGMAVCLLVFASCDLFISNDDSSSQDLIWSLHKPQLDLSGTNVVATQSGVFVTLGNRLQKRDLETGTRIWETHMTDVSFISGTILVSGEVVYLYQIGFGRWVRAFDIRDGRRIWEFVLDNSRGDTFTVPVQDDDHIYVPLIDELVIIDKENGSGQHIAYPVGFEADIARQRPKYVGFESGKWLCLPVGFTASESVPDRGAVHMFDLTSREFRWTYIIPDTVTNETTFFQRPSGCAIARDVAVITSAGRLSAVSLNEGKQVYSRVFDMPGDPNRDGFPPSGIAYDGTYVFAGSARAKVYAFDPETGETRWSTLTKGSFWTVNPVFVNDRVYITNTSFGQLWGLNRTNGSIELNMKVPNPEDDGFATDPSFFEGILVIGGFLQIFAYRL